MCGRVGALSVSVTRCFGLSRMRASTSATARAITHQYSRIRSILSPIPLRVVVAAKLVQIGEPEAEDKARDRGDQRFDEERHAGRSFGPLRAGDTRQLAHLANHLYHLEVVRLAGQDQMAAQRTVMKMGRDLRHFIMIEEGASVMLDPRR